MPSEDFFLPMKTTQLHVGRVFNEIPNKTENVCDVELHRHNFKLKFKNKILLFSISPPLC